MLKKLRIIIFAVLSIVLIGVCVYFFSSETNKSNDIEITLTNTDDLSRYNLVGFGRPESNLSWTTDKQATLEIPMPEIKENHNLVMSVQTFPFLPKKIKKQIVNVYVNDVMVGKWTVDKMGIYTVKLPENIKDYGDKIKLKFNVITAKSPKELKMSKDNNKYGIAIMKIVLSQMNSNNPENFAEYNVGDEIYFDASGHPQKYMGSGWAIAEQHWTWTDGRDAFLNMFVKGVNNNKLQLVLTGRGIFGDKDLSQDVTVYANGKELTTWKFSKENSSYVAKLPESVVENTALKITLHIHKPTKVGNDPRNLGIAVNKVKIAPVFAAKTKTKIALWLKKHLFTDSDSVNEDKK